MVVSLRDVVTVLLPGTGSDDDYLRRALAGPLAEAGASVITVPPQPERLLDGYRRALDDAWRETAGGGRIVVGGVSLGALLATRWAVEHPDRTVAVLALLPPWTGEPGDAPAALSARHTAAQLRRDGLAATTAAMRASSPPWLADELARSWARQWPELPGAMEEAAACPGPSRAELSRLSVPLAVVAAVDDAVHPATVADDWAACAPHSAVAVVRLAEFGPNPTLLGAACLDALAEID